MHCEIMQKINEKAQTANFRDFINRGGAVGHRFMNFNSQKVFLVLRLCLPFKLKANYNLRFLVTVL